MKINILGVKINQESPAEIKNLITDWLSQEPTRLVVTVNPEFVVAARKNKAFQDILNRADLAICDGIGLAWAAKWLKGQKIPRLTGVDLAIDLLKMQKIKIMPRLYLLGGKKNSAELVAEQYPTNVAGANSMVKLISDSQLENNQQIINDINQSDANILLVAFGQIKQENWLADNLSEMPNIKIAMGVGGTFDYLSGQIRRAPKYLRSLGLEWLFRLITQPRRVGRIFNATIVFAWLALKEKIKSNS